MYAASNNTYLPAPTKRMAHKSRLNKHIQGYDGKGSPTHIHLEIFSQKNQSGLS
jgi:hypothetical protein